MGKRNLLPLPPEMLLPLPARPIRPRKMSSLAQGKIDFLKFKETLCHSGIYNSPPSVPTVKRCDLVSQIQDSQRFPSEIHSSAICVSMQTYIYNFYTAIPDSEKKSFKLCLDFAPFAQFPNKPRIRHECEHSTLVSAFLLAPAAQIT